MDHLKAELKSQNSESSLEPGNISYFSRRHLTEDQKKVRTSSVLSTFVNTLKCFIGIVFLNIPQSVATIGIYGSLVGITWVLLINLFSSWMLIKARDRFKYNDVRNLSDLVQLCYGSNAKIASDCLMLVTQFSFLVAYLIFIGDQLDQLSCSYLKATECGHSDSFRVLMVVMLLPGILQKELRNVAYFSMFSLVCFFISAGLMVYMEINILRSKHYSTEVMGLNLTEKDLEYKYFDWSQSILGLSALMTIFEGNSFILTVYAEVDQPKHFYKIITLVYIIIASMLSAWGILSYLAFGNTIDNLVILMFPSSNNLSVIAKIVYIFNICGSYIIMVCPIFSVIEDYQLYKTATFVTGNLKFIIGRLLIVVLSVLASLILPNVNSVLQLNGSICGPLISIVVPFMCYYRAYSLTNENVEVKARRTVQLPSLDDESPLLIVEEQQIISATQTTKKAKSRIRSLTLGLVFCVIGSVIGMFGLYQTVNSIMEQSQSEPIRQIK